MSKNHNELEIIMLSTYSDIVLDILKVHKNLSVIKIITFSYLIKKNKYIHSHIYNASNKNDLVLKCLSQLSGHFDDYCHNIKYIIPAIDILIKKNMITENAGELLYLNTSSLVNMEKSFINQAIKDSNNYSDKQFLKEVVRNV